MKVVDFLNFYMYHSLWIIRIIKCLIKLSTESLAFEKFLLTYGITTGDFREMNLQDKRKYIQKVVMSMLGLFDTIHILNITDKQEIAKTWTNLLSRF